MESIEIDIQTSKSINDENIDGRLTSPYMTRYEYTECVGRRAVMIANGCDPLVDYENMFDPIEIARKEILERKIPLIIIRKLPNGKIEEWSIKDMNIRDY